MDRRIKTVLDTVKEQSEGMSDYEYEEFVYTLIYEIEKTTEINIIND